MNLLRLLALILLSFSASGFALEEGKISVAEADQLIQVKVPMLDVRTRKEWDQGHLKGGVLIDVYDAAFAEKVKKQFDPSKPVLIYCHSGHRSAIAAKQLKALGYKTLYDMNGGIVAWKKADKKVVK